jgi:hypothetical protein
MIFSYVGLERIAQEWLNMEKSADIIESVGNQWYQNVGTAIFTAMVVEIVMPQLTVMINVMIQAIQDIPKYFKTMFYTSDEIKNF